MAIRNKDFLILLIRLFLGYVFFSAGICKLTHGNFGQLIGPPWLEEALAKHGLGLFAQVVAVSQVVCGLLLFTQRFSTLGAVMLVPMNISILAVTVSQNWTGTPYVNTVFLLLNLLLLLYEYQRFTFLFSTAPPAAGAALPLEPLRKGAFPWAVLAAGLATMVVAFFSVPLTNALGLLTFGLTAVLVVRQPLLPTLGKALVLLAVGNMCLVTLAMRLPHAPKAVLGASGIILLLLGTYLWLNARKNSSPAMA